jgi:signal transduction histidine kinase
LPSPHLAVWWNAAYAALVALLVLFALQFTQRARPPITRTLLALPMLAVPLLYAAAAAGVAGPAAQALRAVLVLLAFGALGVVAYHASHRRSGASALFVLAGAASAGLGLRDWLVFREGGSADAVPWTPYAGAPFVVMGSWLLLDQFVRTTRALESVNRGLEQRVAEREAELTARYRDAAALEREQAAGDERQRLLRELHDGLGAKLTQALLRVEQGGLDGAGLSRELRSCLADMRLASETLVPGQTEWSDAVGNFRFRWDALLRAAGLQARWQVELPTSGMTMPPYVALQLLRVMQEALTNVLRHAQATRLAVAVRREGAGLLVRVEDDGRGLPALPPAGARGLADMRTRAAAVGATLVLSQPPGGGTRVELRLSPLPDVAHTGTPLST